MEHYYTIQGEGANTGRACYFIRLGGCDVGCVWCDVKDSWDASQHKLVKVEKMIEWVKQAGADHVVITGGEPLMYDLSQLTKKFRAEKIKLLLETSGAYPLTGKWDWVCVSPKKFKTPLKSVLFSADELKVIVYNKSDFDWALKHATLVNKKCKLFLQPEYGSFSKVLPWLIEFVKGNTLWRISLQTHKVMGID